MDLTTFVTGAFCSCVAAFVGVPVVFVLVLAFAGERSQ